MLGDVLLIQEKHKQAAQIIANKILQNYSRKFVVAISGESGSGKSELSHCIARELKTEGIRAKILHSDNYYKIHPLERTSWRLQNGIDKVGLNEIDWETIEKNIADFKSDRKSDMPCIDIVVDQVDLLTVDFSQNDLLILDGLYAINAEADMKVFIDLTYHETKKAQTDRGKEPQNEYRMKVLEQEHQVVLSLRKKADLFISKEYLVYE